MPLAVENLTKQSSMASIKKAISTSIGQCMDEPTPEGMTKEERQKQCVAIALDTARKKTGKKLGSKT